MRVPLIGLALIVTVGSLVHALAQGCVAVEWRVFWYALGALVVVWFTSGESAPRGTPAAINGRPTAIRPLADHRGQSIPSVAVVDKTHAPKPPTA